jgi:hypothetical protein
MQNPVSDVRTSSVGITLKSVTPHLLAVGMLKSVMELDKPWRMTDAVVTSEAQRNWFLRREICGVVKILAIQAFQLSRTLSRSAKPRPTLSFCRPPAKTQQQPINPGTVVAPAVPAAVAV